MDFKCYYLTCNRSYRSRQNLRRHINTDHLRITNYICSICGRYLSSKKNLIHHTNRHRQLSSIQIKHLSVKQLPKDQQDIKPFLLSSHFKEQPEFCQHNNCYSKFQTFLPPIDSNRQLTSSTPKLKLIPSLLDYLSKTNP